jgi:uncharacterized integral membrane protein
MKPLTLTESLDHLEYAWRAAILILASFVMGFLIGAWVSDREVEA